MREMSKTVDELNLLPKRLKHYKEASLVEEYLSKLKIRDKA